MRLAPLLLCLAFAVTAQAQTTYTWNRTLGDIQPWDVESNWDPVGVPGPGDTALIDGDVRIDEPVTVATVEFGSGRLLGDAPLTVTGRMEWTGGTLDGRDFGADAAIVIPAGATLAIRDGSDKALRGRDLLIDGRLDWNASETLTMPWGTLVHIREGGVGELVGSGGLRRPTNGPFELVVDGVLERSGGGATRLAFDVGEITINGELWVRDGVFVIEDAGPRSFGVNGTGTLRVDGTGTFQLANGFFNLSEVTLVGDGGQVQTTGGELWLGAADYDGTLVCQGGEMYFAQPAESTHVAAVRLLDGQFGAEPPLAGGVTVDNEIAWVGGDIGRSATIVNNGDFVFSTGMGSFPPRRIRGVTLVNRGTWWWTGDTEVVIAGTAVIQNAPEGRIEIRGSGGFDRATGFIVLENDGYIGKRESQDAFEWTSEFGRFWNRGMVEINAGSFVVEGSPPGESDADTGTWLVGAGGAIRFQGRRFSGPTSTLDGDGTVRFDELEAFSQLRFRIRGGEDDGLLVEGDLPELEPEATIVVSPEINVPGRPVLTVEGAAELSGTVELGDEEPVAVGDRFAILAAAEITGAFDALALPPGVAAVVEVANGVAELVVTTVVDAETAPDPAALAVAVAPNPARGAATVTLDVPAAEAVVVEVVDALGRTVARLAEGDRAPGRHTVSVGAGRLAPGVYLVRARAGATVATARLTVVR